MNTKQYLGSKIKELRGRDDLTQEEFSGMLNLSRASILNMEAGRHSPTVEVLYLLCCIFQVDPNYLLPPIVQVEKKKTTKTIIKKIIKTRFKPVKL